MAKSKKITPPYVVVPNFLTEEECNNIISIGSKAPAKKEEFGAEDGRYSHVSTFTPCMFTNPDKEYGKRLHARMEKINKEVFGFDVNTKKWLHGNFLKYEKKGFTGWHHDGGFGGIDPSYSGRKLSFVIMLSCGDTEYIGGDLTFPFYLKPTEEEQKLIRQKGTLVVFPSFVFHEVTPVKRGLRYTLAYFLTGPKFK